MYSPNQLFYEVPRYAYDAQVTTPIFTIEALCLLTYYAEPFSRLIVKVTAYTALAYSYSVDF